MDEVLKLLRYNTGTDKKAFAMFKKHFDFDAVIFNATIVAFSGSAVADLVSVHKNRFIIDPQTHIYQHATTAIKTKSRGSEVPKVKKSVEKFLSKMPTNLERILLIEDRPANIADIRANIDELVEKTYDFQLKFIPSFIKEKRYNKYLEFANVKPEPKLLIAPYFMIKKDYTSDEITGWMALNKDLLDNFSQKHGASDIIASQLVIDKNVLLKQDLPKLISNTYSAKSCKYAFIWIDNFNSFQSRENERKAFSSLLETFRELNIKPIMAYGGYDSIFLCHEEITNRLYGVAQSVGYGEQREITPVGGGLPTNKYYFMPLHQRLKFSDAAGILRTHGYFDESIPKSTRASNYFNYICSCEQCKMVIGKNIDNFGLYNESVPFTMKNNISRARPTTEASLLAAMHFLWCKKHEWESLLKPLPELTDTLLANVALYHPDFEQGMKEWCAEYAR